MSVINDAIRWLRESRIYSGQIGGFYAFYNSRKREIAPYIYSEVTGYGVKLFINLYHWTEDTDFLREAENMANFLLKIQHKNGAFPFAYYPNNDKVSMRFFSFDTAVCISSLVDLYTENQNAKYLKGAMAAGEWLVSKAQNSDGSFKCMYDEGTRRFKNINEWFGDKGSLHAKNAIGLLKLYIVTNEEKYKESAQRVCDWATRNVQKKSGAFQINPNHDWIFTHGHCYAVEGILYAYTILHYNRYFNAALKGGKWLMKARRSNGALLEKYGDSMIRKVFRTDATAQAMRLWIVLHRITGDENFLYPRRSLEFLLSMQCRKRDDAQGYGGFYNELSQFFLCRNLDNKLYAWVSMFSLHVFSLLRRLRSGKLGENIIDELF